MMCFFNQFYIYFFIYLRGQNILKSKLKLGYYCTRNSEYIVLLN